MANATMTVTERLEMMQTAWNAGRTVYIHSQTRIMKITAKNAKKWADAGLVLVKVKGSDLWLASGRKFVCINYNAITTEAR